MLQPIGLTVHTTESGQTWTGNNTEATSHWFGDWAAEMLAEKRATREELGQLFESMFGGDKDFVFSISRQDLQAIQTPMLVLMGMDLYHPSETSREIKRLASNARLLEHWRDAGPQV